MSRTFWPDICARSPLERPCYRWSGCTCDGEACGAGVWPLQIKAQAHSLPLPTRRGASVMSGPLWPLTSEYSLHSRRDNGGPGRDPVGTRVGPGRDPGETRAGPGRGPGGTWRHGSAKLRSEGGPWGLGVQLGSSPQARTAHQGVARRSWGTGRCAGPSQSGCNGSRSLLTRVSAGSLPGPSRVPSRVKKEPSARSTRCFGASKPSNNDAEPWPVSPLHCAPSTRAPHSLNLTKCGFVGVRTVVLRGFSDSIG